MLRQAALGLAIGVAGIALLPKILPGSLLLLGLGIFLLAVIIVFMMI